MNRREKLFFGIPIITILFIFTLSLLFKSFLKGLFATIFLALFIFIIFFLFFMLIDTFLTKTIPWLYEDRKEKDYPRWAKWFLKFREF